MPSSKPQKSKLPQPQFLGANSSELRLESVLADLSLHQFQVEVHHKGTEIVQLLEQHPHLPGVVLLDRNQFVGVIPRQRLLEILIRPQGMTFLPNPLSVLYGYLRTNHLALSASTPILVAAQLALRRSPDQQADPIVVQMDAADAADTTTYCLLDIHELNIAYWQLRGVETQVRYERTQIQIVQTEKMAGLGRLVDGVAHEILDPVGFIWGNLTHLSTYTDQVMQLLAAYEQHFPDSPEEINQLQTEIELDYLREDLPQTIASIRSGAERLKNLVTSLQNFCHIDDVYPKPADIHECLDSILLLLKSRVSGEIQIVRDYGHLPPVTCYAGQLNQVFMNILTNAINALLNQAVQQELIEDMRGRNQAKLWQATASKPCITIKTQVRPAPVDAEQNVASRWVVICIADNGPGLSAESYQQILDSFSIEKRADKETSLAVSYQIVTAKHGGKLYFRSYGAGMPVNSLSNANLSEHGTEFEIWLPLV